MPEGLTIQLILPGIFDQEKLYDTGTWVRWLEMALLVGSSSWANFKSLMASSKFCSS